MSEDHRFQPGEEAVLLEPLRSYERGPKAEIGEKVTVLLAWPKDNRPGYRVRYREPGTQRELHVVVPATSLARIETGACASPSAVIVPSR